MAVRSTAHFAGRIAARYRRARMRQPPLVLAYLRGLPRGVRARQSGQGSITRIGAYNVRLGPLYLSHSTEAGAARVTAVMLRPGGRPQSAVRFPRLRTPLAQLLARSGERQARLHSGGPITPALPPRLDRVTVARAAPVPMVLRRPVVSPSSPLPASQPAAAESTRGAPTPAPRAIALAPAEVDRLTAHVLRTLDHRVTAFRERRGKA